MRSLLILFCRIFAIEVNTLCLAQNKKHNGKPLYDKQINYFLSHTTLYGSLDNRRNCYYFKKTFKGENCLGDCIKLKFSLDQNQASVTLFFFFFDKSENRDLSLQTSSQEPRHLAILIIALINIYFKPNLLRKCLTWPLLSLLQTNGIKLKILQVAGVLRYFGSFPV